MATQPHPPSSLPNLNKIRTKRTNDLPTILMEYFLDLESKGIVLIILRTQIFSISFPYLPKEKLIQTNTHLEYNNSPWTLWLQILPLIKNMSDKIYSKSCLLNSQTLFIYALLNQISCVRRMICKLNLLSVLVVIS